MISGADALYSVHPSPAVRLEAPKGRHHLKADPGDFAFPDEGMATALVVDGAYFLRRLGWSFPGLDTSDPRNVSRALWWLTAWHLQHRIHARFRIGEHLVDAIEQDEGADFIESPHLYRIFFYDCPPLTKKMHQPISQKSIDLSRTSAAKQRLAIHDELRGVRKLSLRLGRLNDTSEWKLKAATTKRLIDSPSIVLTDDDFEIDTKQKGVDMKLGLDVAAMAFKKQVDQIILVAGDADFVPATKLARREGIDVVLDPMGGKPAADLFQHIDGLRSARYPGERVA